MKEWLNDDDGITSPPKLVQVGVAAVAVFCGTALSQFFKAEPSARVESGAAIPTQVEIVPAK